MFRVKSLIFNSDNIAEVHVGSLFYFSAQVFPDDGNSISVKLKCSQNLDHWIDTEGCNCVHKFQFESEYDAKEYANKVYNYELNKFLAEVHNGLSKYVEVIK